MVEGAYHDGRLLYKFWVEVGMEYKVVKGVVRGGYEAWNCWVYWIA